MNLKKEARGVKSRRFTAAILLITLMTATLLSACGKNVSTNESVDGAANTSTTFIVGFDAEFPPYGYKDASGEYVGFDLSLATEVCDRLGWTLVKQPIEWASKDMELNSGSISCIWNGFTMNGREDDYTWSAAYVDNSQVVVVKNGSGISSLSDLKGKNVIVQADSSALAALEGEDASEENIELAKTFKSLQQVSDYNSAFLNLESGVADAICMDIGVAKYEIESRGDKYVMLDEKLSTEAYGIGFKKGNTELRDTVMGTLLDMVEDGTFARIAKAWDLEDSVCLTVDSVAPDKSSTDTSVKSGNSKLTQFLKVSGQLLEGFGATVLIFALTLLFSLPLGLGICALRRSKIKLLSILARIYISIVRGTPLMLQLLVVFFGPYYVFNISLSNTYRFYAVIIGFTLNYAAYFAEIFRSGFEAIPVGQREAATVLGYSRGQIYTRILLPQMIKIVLPSVTNEVITLVKDTSLAFALAYTEMFTVAKQISAANTSIMPLFIAGLFYYVFNALVAFVMHRIESSMNYGRGAN